MSNSTIIKKALIDTIGAIAYIGLVAWFMTNAEHMFGITRSVIVPVLMLTLFVLSAAVTGSLVFGRSVLWYMDGNKKDAIVLLFAKLVVLLISFVLTLSVLSYSIQL